MLYEFECRICGMTKEVYRSAEESSLPVTCDLCDSKMNRIYTAPGVAVFHPYYNEGLGCKIRKSKDVSDAIQKIKDETGREIIETGTEKTRIKKKPRNSYQLTREEYNRARTILGDEN
jgi:putative FmdB family regulatory protein